MFDALLERGHNVHDRLLFLRNADHFPAGNLGFNHLAQRVTVTIVQIELVEGRSHGFDQIDGQLQFILVDVFMLELRDIPHFPDFLRVAQFVKHEPAVQRGNRDHFLAIAQHHFADADFAAGLQGLAQ